MHNCTVNIFHNNVAVTQYQNQFNVSVLQHLKCADVVKQYNYATGVASENSPLITSFITNFGT